MRTQYAFGLGLFFVTVGGCTKDTPPPSREQLLTATNWRISSVVALEIRPGQAPQTSDLFASRPACEKDNSLRFYPDKTVEVDAGPLRCLSTDPQIITGTWSLDNARGELITTEPGGSPDTVQLEQLTSTTLAVSTTYDAGSLKEKITTTFTAF